MSNERIFNFSAGPSIMPQSVLERAQRELLNCNGSGISVMEMNHRTPMFAEIFEGAKAKLKALMNIPDTHEILLLQGGATLQFASIPMNLIGDGFADYSPVDERYGRLVSVKTSMPKVITPEITMPTTWYVQFAIPTAALEPYCGPIGALAGQHWTCNFYKCAGDSSHSHYITWSPIPECNFHLPNFFAPIDFE